MEPKDILFLSLVLVFSCLVLIFLLLFSCSHHMFSYFFFFIWMTVNYHNHRFHATQGYFLRISVIMFSHFVLVFLWLFSCSHYLFLSPFLMFSSLVLVLTSYLCVCVTVNYYNHRFHETQRYCVLISVIIFPPYVFVFVLLFSCSRLLFSCSRHLFSCSHAVFSCSHHLFSCSHFFVFFSVVFIIFWCFCW